MPKKYRGGVNPVGHEQHIIYKDPPKSIFTRKYEPVNVADIMYMYQSDNPNGDSSRINESIQYYARGKNPMVEVDYGNGRGASNPYKVETVRPPLYHIEDLVAISAPHIHQNYSITTNPSVTPTLINDYVDKSVIKHIVSNDPISGLIRSNPSKDFYIEENDRTEKIKNIKTKDMLNGNVQSNLTFKEDYNTVNRNSKLNMKDILEGNVQTNLTFKEDYNIVNRDSKLNMKDILEGSVQPNNSYNIDMNRELINDINVSTKGDRMPLTSLTTNFSSIIVFDPKSNTSIDVSATIKDKNNIAVSAAIGAPITLTTLEGKVLNLRDYTYSVVQSNINNNQFVIQIDQPDIELERNIPLYHAQTNISGLRGYNENMTRVNLDQISLNKLNTFGNYIDRVSFPVYNAERSIPINSSIKVKN